MLKIIAVDFYDLIWQQETLFSEADIDRLFRKYAEHRVDAVLWRLSVCGSCCTAARLQTVRRG